MFTSGVVRPARRAPFAVGKAISGTPGRIVAVHDDWALVDRGEWGQFGCALEDLLPAGGTITSPAVE